MSHTQGLAPLQSLESLNLYSNRVADFAVRPAALACF